MRVKLLVAVIFLTVGFVGLLLLKSRNRAPQGAPSVRTPQDITAALQKDRGQLALHISAAQAGIDDELTFAMQLTNVSDSEVFVAKSTKVPQQEEDATFFLQVQPMTLSLFGIFPTAPDSKVVYKLGPGEIDTTEWRGSFREVLNGLVVPIEEQRSGEYFVRATYMGKCADAASLKYLCNTVTSEWVKIQIQG
jgi:hypothetical protein